MVLGITSDLATTPNIVLVPSRSSRNNSCMEIGKKNST